MTDLKQEAKREDREVENTLSLRPDQYNKKLTLVRRTSNSEDLSDVVVFFV